MADFIWHDNGTWEPIPAPPEPEGIPAGTYKVTITEVGQKPGSLDCMSVRFTVTDGEYKGESYREKIRCGNLSMICAARVSMSCSVHRASPSNCRAAATQRWRSTSRRLTRAVAPCSIR